MSPPRVYLNKLRDSKPVSITSDELQTSSLDVLMNKYACGLNSKEVENHSFLTPDKIADRLLNSKIEKIVSIANEHHAVAVLPKLSSTRVSFTKSLKFTVINCPANDWTTADWGNLFSIVSFYSSPNIPMYALYFTFLHIDDFEGPIHKDNTKLVHTDFEFTKDDDKATCDSIEKDAKNNKLSIPPVMVERFWKHPEYCNFEIADGNHRITALKNMGYKGFVPVIVADYDISGTPDYLPLIIKHNIADVTIAKIENSVVHISIYPSERFQANKRKDVVSSITSFFQQKKTEDSMASSSSSHRSKSKKLRLV